MREFEQLEDLDTVAQGDIFEWVEARRARPWHVYGVVVTADCDLALEKHGGFISYVPAMLSDDFIWARWRLERFANPLQAHLERAARRVSARLEPGGEGTGLSAEAMRKWLERAKVDGVLDELGVTAAGERANLSNVLKPTELLMTLMSRESPDLKLLRSAYEIIKPAFVGDRKLIAADIQKSWNSLPGDLFHLPAIPGADTSDGGGLFLHLRHIRQMSADALSARPDVLRRGAADCRRVARIGAPYRYAMTQALGRVFTDIGLPDAYEARCRGAAELFLKEPEPS